MKPSTFTLLMLTLLYGSGFGLLWYQTNWKTSLAVFLIIWAALLQVYVNLRSEAH